MTKFTHIISVLVQVIYKPKSYAVLTVKHSRKTLGLTKIFLCRLLLQWNIDEIDYLSDFINPPSTYVPNQVSLSMLRVPCSYMYNKSAYPCCVSHVHMYIIVLMVTAYWLFYDNYFQQNLMWFQVFVFVGIVQLKIRKCLMKSSVVTVAYQ